MKNFSQEVMKCIMENKDLNEFFREILEKSTNEILNNQLINVIEKIKRSDKINADYFETVTTDYGTLGISIPKELLNQENDSILDSKTDLETMVIHMFKQGLSAADIAVVIEKMYGPNKNVIVSEQKSKTVGRLAFKEADAAVSQFGNKVASDSYLCVYFSKIKIPLRVKTGSRKFIYFSIGMNKTGNKEVLSYVISNKDGSKEWTKILDNMEEKGVKDVSLFISEESLELKKD